MAFKIEFGSRHVDANELAVLAAWVVVGMQFVCMHVLGARGTDNGVLGLALGLGVLFVADRIVADMVAAAGAWAVRFSTIDKRGWTFFAAFVAFVVSKLMVILVAWEIVHRLLPAWWIRDTLTAVLGLYAILYVFAFGGTMIKCVVFGETDRIVRRRQPPPELIVGDDAPDA